jgi:hypothetical protein
VRNRSLWIVALVAVAALSVAAAAASMRMTHGFSSYYAAAHALVAGEFGPWVYRDLVFGQYLRTLVGEDIREIYAPNTPAAALLAVPVVWLPPMVARTVWLGLSVSALLAAVFWLTIDAARRSTPLLPLWSAAALINAAVLANIRTAQAYVLLFAATVVALRALERDRDALAGIVLGIVFAAKPTIAPLLFMLFWIRRHRAVLWAIGTAAAIVVLTVPAVSLDAWMAWPDVARAFIARPSTGVAAYQTTTGLLRHLCVADGTNPSPIARCGLAAAVVPPLAILASLAITVSAIARTQDRFAIAAGLCLSMLATPIAEDHQFVLLAIPIFILAADAPEQRPWLVLSVILLVVPASWTWERFTAGWWALLGYPRLFATWALWAMTIAAARHHEQHETGAAAARTARRAEPI